MRKKLVLLSAMAILPAAVMAESATVSGFADITHTYDADQSVFGATAEVDFANKMDNVSVRVDTDLNLLGDSATIEQAFFAFSATKNITILGGAFNNPIGMEKEDAPDMPAISKGQIWGVLDNQTALNGNNVAGIAAAAGVGPATITVGALNDINHADLEKNSFALVANVTPMKDLDLELGYVTSEGAAGNVMDVNVAYSIAGAMVTLDYLKPDDVIDSSMEVGLGYAVTPKIGAYVRYGATAYAAGGDDANSITVYGSYKLASNLSVAAEYYTSNLVDKTNPIIGTQEDDNAMFGLEFIATF